MFKHSIAAGFREPEISVYFDPLLTYERRNSRRNKVSPPPSNPLMKAEAFQGLVDTWYDPLYRFALSLTRNGDDALDLTQHTFARWAEKGDRLRDESKVKSWLFTVLYREFLDSRKIKQREVQGELETTLDLHHSTPNRVAEHLDAKTAMAALWELNHDFRAPLTLFYLENHSYKEIAEVLSIPIGTVMSRIARGKDQLRSKLMRTNSGTGQVIPMPQLKEGHHG